MIKSEEHGSTYDDGLIICHAEDLNKGGGRPVPRRT